ncbi:hypothetical protein B0H19DRAFT_1276566 [Mycena capillaripes]|nr:hypothetical protein B0H19DRAFT_1276566 [Mycena capillaripes]
MPVCVFAGDMLRRLPPLAPPRLRHHKPLRTRRIRSAHIAFTTADPTNSPLFITALALRIQRRVASIVYACIFNFLVGISRTYASHQRCTLQRLHDASYARLNAHHITSDSLSGAVALPSPSPPFPAWFISLGAPLFFSGKLLGEFRG